MRRSILLLALSAAILGGCTSAYKTGQTPDDVYFSPERQHDEYVNVKERNDDRRYQGDDDYYDDRYLRMKVSNRVMWSDLDDWYFYNRRYSYSYYNNWNNPWTPYTYWNYYYNPYCSHNVVYGTQTKVTYNHPRVFNLNTYNSTQLTNNNYTNPKANIFNNNSNYNNNRSPRIIGSYTPSNTNTSSNAGNFLRNVFNSGSNSSSGSSNNSSSKSSSNSSSSSSGSSGSSAPVRKF
ncbi:MAG TPA: hypothetical protein VGQ09_15580 [Chitinophagaceae bacterium]|jgi:uncharacterized membrane protein YgcG|nr:hypothetical protein [Chitinophagaceae bacterium]